jgi:RNA polymerase sigma-70 factor (ECF subfamily)
MARLKTRRRTTSQAELLVRSLYEEHGNALLAYATRLTQDRAAAEDIVQEALVRAWRNAESLTEDKGSVRGWLFTVARNLVVDRARAKASRPAEVAETPAVMVAEDDHADQVVDSMTVYGALTSLSGDHRRVLLELYFRGRTVAETATVLGVAPGTVKSRSHYALVALRKVFGVRVGSLEGVAG